MNREAPADPGRQPGVHTSVRVALIVLGLLPILVATLYPGSGPLPRGWSLTFASGPTPYNEIVQNLLLFIPLGAALVLVGARPLAAIAIGTALSAGVEFIQQWIPGRDPSAGDIACNLASTAIGVGLARTAHRWLLVPPRRAAWQSCAAAVAAAAIWLGLGAGLQPLQTLGDGWRTIFFTTLIPPWGQEVLDAAWIGAGWVPIGFWGRRHPATWVGIAIAAAALVAGPWVVALRPTPLAELAAAAAGAAVGVALHRAAHRN